MLLEKDLSSAKLVSLIDKILLDREQMEKMQAAARKLGIRDASWRLYEVMENLAAKAKS